MKRGLILLLALGVAAVSFLPYRGVGDFALVNLDDYAYVLRSPVGQGVSVANIKWAFGAFGFQAIWMPATWISFMVDASLWGLRPGLLHLHNAILHALDALLVFVLLAQLLAKGRWAADGNGDRRRPQASSVGDAQRALCAVFLASALAALFWSLHPLRVESVAWVAERKDVLFLFWELLALIGWVRDAEQAAHREQSAGSGARRLSGYWWFSLACFAVAGLAKPTVMTFPLLAALLEYLVIRRVRFKALLWPFLMALAMAGSAHHAQAMAGAMTPLADVPLCARLANAVAAVGTYCWKTVWPSELAIPYLNAWPAWPKFLVPGAAICAGYAWALLWSARTAWPCDPPWPEWKERLPPKTVAWIRRVAGGVAPASSPRSCPTEWARVLFVGLSWFLVAVAPTLGIANFGYHSHADRFTYLPAIGFSLVAAAGLAALVQRGRLVGWAVCLVWVAVLGVWAGVSWRQTQVWRNTMTLFSHAVEVTGEQNVIAQQSLGIDVFGSSGNAEVALPYWEKSFRYGRDKLRMGRTDRYVLLLAQAGHLEEAIAETRRFSDWAEEQRNKKIEQSSLAPGDSLVWQDDGPRLAADGYTALSKMCYAAIAYFGGDRELAKEHLEGVLQQNGGNPCAHYLLGIMALEERRVRDAIDHWKISEAGDAFFCFLQGWIARLERNGHDPLPIRYPGGGPNNGQKQ